MVKISGFYDEISTNLDTQLAVIKELKEEYFCPRNINGKNISDFTLEEYKEVIAPKLARYDIKISTIGSSIGKIPLEDEEAFLLQKQKLKNIAEICQVAKCKYIRIFSFFVNQKGDYNLYANRVVAKLTELLDVVKEYDVILLHENEKGIFGDEPNRVKYLYQTLNNKQFGLCYDASNYIQCGYDPKEAYLITKEFTTEYHIKDCSEEKIEVPLGMGKGEYKDMLDDLINKKNYQGFLTLEPHTAKYAMFKRLFYLLPFLNLILKNASSVFRRIDKYLGKKSMQKVTKKEVFLVQYHNLKKLIKGVSNGKS